jgi:tetraacyldisaccharide 4'-kinase
MSILPDPETFRRLADGSLRGVGPTASRAILTVLAGPYGLVTACRNHLHDCRLLPRTRASVPVISVGNITAGGTGKTPIVAWLCRQLASMGRRPAIVSRGYAARPGEPSDEAAELAILLPGVPHVANRDRGSGARAAARLGADVVVLDDGFQHRRLHRDLDLVAIDASDPFGCGHLLPRGLLRESIRGLIRADAIVLTRATSIPPAARDEIRAAVTRARRGIPPAVWLETEHRPVAVRSSSGTREPLDAIRGQPVAAFCGIGNPAAFRRTLGDLGVELVGFQSFADHHPYTIADLTAVAAWATTNGASRLLTTLKDLVRIRDERLGDLPLAAVEVALEPLGDTLNLEQLLQTTVRT